MEALNQKLLMEQSPDITDSINKANKPQLTQSQVSLLGQEDYSKEENWIIIDN